MNVPVLCMDPHCMITREHEAHDHPAKGAPKVGQEVTTSAQVPIKEIVKLSLAEDEIALIRVPKGSLTDADIDAFMEWVGTTPLTGKIVLMEFDSMDVVKVANES